jgi:hypothetical protein
MKIKIVRGWVDKAGLFVLPVGIAVVVCIATQGCGGKGAGKGDAEIPRPVVVAPGIQLQSHQAANSVSRGA